MVNLFTGGSQDNRKLPGSLHWREGRGKKGKPLHFKGE